VTAASEWPCLRPDRALRVAALVKPIPPFEAHALDAGGRLRRTGLVLEMNPYCRRAVAAGIAIARAAGGRCTVFSLGPPAAETVVREALAFGADRGVLISDPAFAGSDTLATAHAVVAALRRLGPFDVVLAGLSSVDAETGQVGPEIAELLGYGFLAGVRELAIDGARLLVRCEQDDGSLHATARLPLLLSVAERLCAPCKAPPEARAAVAGERIVHLAAADLGVGPWGEAASPTYVGEIRAQPRSRRPLRLSGPLTAQARTAAQTLVARGVFDAVTAAPAASVPIRRPRTEPPIAVLCEPDRPRLNRALCGEAARLAGDIQGHVRAFTTVVDECAALGAWGADAVTIVRGARLAEDFARGAGAWVQAARPWAVLAPGTAWGRETAGRIAARTGSALTGDAVSLAVVERRLVAWKPAFSGKLLAAIHARSPIQMATVRPGVLAIPRPREPGAECDEIEIQPTPAITIDARQRADELEALETARIVIGEGLGVARDDYPRLEALRLRLGAELAATRKVTDRGWLPRARQIGLTGRAIAPRLYIALGLSGRYTHAVGIANAHTVLAINTDPGAPIFEACDIGIVADWQTAIAALLSELQRCGPGRRGQ